MVVKRLAFVGWTVESHWMFIVLVVSIIMSEAT